MNDVLLHQRSSSLHQRGPFELYETIFTYRKNNTAVPTMNTSPPISSVGGEEAAN